MLKTYRHVIMISLSKIKILLLQTILDILKLVFGM